MTSINRTSPLLLWTFMLGNLVIGTGILLPAGLLNVIAADFGISAARAGLLQVASGLMIGIGAPLLAWLTSRVDRRTLLASSLGLFAAGHWAAAFSPNFEMLLVVRTIAVAAAAIFTPQAAATLGLILPQEKRASAISFIFIGWSLSSVIGIPSGTLLAEYFGWRGAFIGMGALSALAGLAVAFTLRGGVMAQPISLSSWFSVFSKPVLPVIMLVTLFSMSGQFASLTYLAPYLAQGFGAATTGIAIMFAIVGIGGVIGNFVASRVVERLGVDTCVLVALLLLVAGMAVVALSYGYFWPAMLGALLWGLGSFSSNSVQQSRLVAAAPALAGATVALNTSAVYLGQSLGAGAGGIVVGHGISPWLSWLSAAFLALAAVTSIAASRLAVQRPAKAP